MLRAMSLTTAAITGGNVTGTNAPYVVARCGIPFIKASSGTMGNNGAVSALTALPTTYSSGAWLWLPAGAIAAGVPAAASWYWFVASSTTAGTVYNSTYTSGIPTLGVTTAFATTGPGAFTGDTGSVTGPQYTLTGGALGPNGVFSAEEKWSATNNADVKTKILKFGATNMTTTISLASVLNYIDQTYVQNRGVQTAQVSTINNAAFTGLGSSGSGLIYGTADTSGNLTIARVMTASGAATDNIIFEAFVDTVMYGP